ncbi:MAG TPA: hypothetical protein VMK12_05095, partial [Anaeromyxobacteraceae bacterium]|nr:hypothetical protein [Anaeromyxobacteraceae bacterium]
MRRGARSPCGPIGCAAATASGENEGSLLERAGATIKKPETREEAWGLNVPSSGAALAVPKAERQIHGTA